MKEEKYQHVNNAVSITVYHPEGRAISSEARKEIEEALCQLANEHKLLTHLVSV